VIQEVNHQPVHNVAEFEQALHKAGKENALLLVNAAVQHSLSRSNQHRIDKAKTGCVERRSRFYFVRFCAPLHQAIWEI